MFPIDNPIIEFLYWVINTPGVGGALAIMLGIGSATVYLLTFRWIKRGGDADERETYAYPTPALHAHHEE